MGESRDFGFWPPTGSPVQRSGPDHRRGSSLVLTEPTQHDDLLIPLPSGGADRMSGEMMRRIGQRQLQVPP
jgi:hypothetical protein